MEKIEKKSHYAEKTERGDPLGFFNIHSVSKLQKKKGGPLRKKFPKKVAMPKKKLKRGTLWPHPVLYVTRETVLVQFLVPTGTIL